MLTGLQERVWGILSGLPEASGFVLAGGAALIVSGIVDRLSKDLDIFGEYPATVTDFADAAVQALNSQGLSTTLERRGPTYARLEITDGADATSVDFASDVRRRPGIATPRGPMLDPRELAADKMLALVARVEPRDYIDLEAIAQCYDIRDVIRWAEDKDGGFALWQLQDALRRFDSISPDHFEIEQDGYQQLRAFVHDLHRSIR